MPEGPPRALAQGQRLAAPGRSRAAGVSCRREVEEYFVETLVPGDTFVFSGEILRYEALVEDEVYVSRANSEDPKVPAYEGGKFPLSTYLADRVGAMSRRVRRYGRRCRNRARVAPHPGVAHRWCSGKRDLLCRDLPALRSNSIWSAIRSRGGSLIRHLGCC